MDDTRVAVVQMTSRVGDVDGNVARIGEFVESAARERVDIVCFPELSISGYNAGDASRPEPEPIDCEAVQGLAEVGKRSGIAFLAGLLERDVGGIVYNTQIAFGADGVGGIYRKTHVPTSEIGTWRHGSELPVLAHAKMRFGIEICYDSHFPEVSTLLAEKGAEMLFLPHASGGSETAEDKQARWLRYMPARAYDNTVFVGVCNQVGDNGAGRIFAGVSFICDPLGRVVAEASSGTEEEMVIADLQAETLAAARRVPETFFRHFRRPEIYERWVQS